MIRTRGLTKDFARGDATVHAVRGLDLDIAPGELVAVLGPNGAGRSTTVRMLTTLIAPAAGTAEVGAHRPADAGRARDDRGPHYALHGRGRRDGQVGGRGRPRPDHRRRHRRPVQGGSRGRPGGADLAAGTARTSWRPSARCSR